MLNNWAACFAYSIDPKNHRFGMCIPALLLQLNRIAVFEFRISSRPLVIIFHYFFTNKVHLAYILI